MISNFPGATSQQPRVCSTEPRIWKNCPTLSDSELPERELFRVNATRANLEADERSPGSPTAPIPRL